MAITREELKVGVPYRVTHRSELRKGDIVYLVYDDGSTAPKFNRNKDAGRYDDGSYYIHLRFLEKAYKFNVGDIIKRQYYYKVLAVTDYGYVTTTRSDNIAKAEEESEVDEVLVLNDAAEGYSLATKETELTLQQIANKFNIDVANLRIKG